MVAILSHYVATDANDVAAKLQALTHTCGYTRGWVDPINPLLIWFLPDCPADAAETALAAVVVSSVTTHIKAQAYIKDPFDQIQAIINAVTGDASQWIDVNANTHLAVFLHSLPILRPFIIQELINQGLVV